jgi:hypothetical protein
MVGTQDVHDEATGSGSGNCGKDMQLKVWDKKYPSKITTLREKQHKQTSASENVPDP